MCCSAHPVQIANIEDLKQFFRFCASEEEVLAWLPITRWLVQVQDVDAWVSCQILQLWSEQRAADFRVAPVFAAASFVHFMRSICDLVRTCHDFVRADMFLHAPAIVFVFSHLCAQPLKCLVSAFRK